MSNQQHIYDSHQRKVIDLSEGHWLVLAPPGCGKTDILAARVQRALEQGTPPEQMVCLTFTNRASRGMRERIDQMLGKEKGGAVFTGNLHSLCSNMLFSNRMVHHNASVIDEQDSTDLILDYIAERKILTTRRNNFADQCYRLQHLLWQMAHGHPKELQTNRSMLSGSMVQQLCMHWDRPVTLEGLLDLYRHAPELIDNPRAQQLDTNNELLQQMAVAQWYGQYKEEHRLIDFSDLLTMAYDALVRKPERMPHYSWIQIDEVQDLNRLQLAIIDLLTVQDQPSMVLYLGDEQQAIFSFMGAQLQTLEWIKQRCDNKILHLLTNYRSPSYLQEVFNTFAARQLGTDPDFLPIPSRQQQREHDDLLIHYAFSERSACNDVARMVRHFPSDERTALLVASNQEADMLGHALDEQLVPYFKISGEDFFATPEMQLLIAHLKVIHNEGDTVAWARLLQRMGITDSFSNGRRLLERMSPLALLPTDLMEERPYTQQFAEAMRGDCVVFDTETTGLDITTDDIVQIAAFRIRGGVYSGRPEDTLNLLIRTSLPLPEMLGTVVNPLIEPYREAEAKGTLLEADEGLRQFLDFCQGLPLVGHNVEYDYRILQYNLMRRCHRYDLEQIHPHYFDTLKTARLFYPQMGSHKLKDLIAELKIEGENSHMADDDALATVRLAFHLAEQAEAVAPQQQALLRQYDKERAMLRDNYTHIYHDICRMRYPDVDAVGDSPLLLDALVRSYTLMEKGNRYHPVDKLPYLLSFIRHHFRHHNMPSTLPGQLDLFMPVLSTLRESDLVGSEVGMDIDGRQVVISTIHKAKGLEFENVIVFNVVEGRYPHFFNSRYPDRSARDQEDARKLYVAVTRAKKRLVMVVPKNQSCRSNTGEWYMKRCNPSSFLNPIASLFDIDESDNDHYNEQLFLSQTHVACWRFEVSHIADGNVYGILNEDSGDVVRVDFTAYNPYGSWSWMLRALGVGTVLNLVQPKRQGDTVWADLYIYEPDYLVSATDITGCLKDYGDSSFHHLLGKMKSAAPNRHFLLGNLVGKFLDDEVFHRSVSYEESHQDFFDKNMLYYTRSTEDAEFNPDEFDAQARRQRDNIHTIFTQLMPTIQGYRDGQSVLEPSFLCQMLGLEGRMDFLQSDFTVLLEQKSGKCDEFNGMRSKLEHRAQLLLYRAILHFNFNIPSDAIASHTLYTRYPNGLIAESPDAAVLYRALCVRNALVCRLKRYMEPQGLDFLDTLQPSDLPHDSGRFYTQYQLPVIQSVLDPIRNASPLERSYFKRYFQFALREDWIEMMGVPHTNEYGQSALWLMPASEKRNGGRLLDNLTLESMLDKDSQPVVDRGQAVAQLVLQLPENHVDSNFRQGDRVALYSYHPFTDNEQFGSRRRDQICRSMVFIGTLAAIGQQQVTVTLAAAQSNQALFVPQSDQLWAIEPYQTSSSQSAVYEGLHSFLSADAHRRGLILGTESPRTDPTVQPHYSYDDPLHQTLVCRAMQAQDYFLVMGPPGTGKTSVALMNILREELCRPQASVLLCAFTNQAVDEICHKILHSNQPIDFVRMGSSSAVSPAIRPYLLQERLRDCHTPQQVRETVASIPVVVATVSTMSKGTLFGMKHFSLAIVDEASQLLETQLLPLLTARSGDRMAIDRFVFIGDHKQLASIVGQSPDESSITDPLLTEQGFTNCGQSLFERLYRRHITEGDDSPFAIMLRKQGRMHVDIADFPNRFFYGSRLEPLCARQEQALAVVEGGDSWLGQMLSSHRFLFFDVQPDEVNLLASNVNTREADLIAQIVQSLYWQQGPEQFHPDTSIGVIVPYRMQISAVRDAILRLDSLSLELRQLLSTITIDTVERYQGSQRKAIIYGFTVKEPHQLAFLCSNTFTDPERDVLIDRKLNVTMTRAQEHLILVGNSSLLSYNPLFRSLVEYAKERGCFYSSLR